MNDKYFMQQALTQAKRSLDEGGIPIGAVLIKSNEIIGKGYNKRVQSDDPTAHAEMDCIRNAGRRNDYKSLTLYTTLSPCMMCTGAIIQFGIGRVVIGDNINYEGNSDIIIDNNIEVSITKCDECINIMSSFINSNRDIWNEDIGN